MKVLITGAGGQLGKELLSQAPGDWQVAGPGHEALDIADPDQVEAAFSRIQPDLAINAAAYTGVDAAETDRKTAFAVNAKGPENLARVCAHAHIPLVHISTDFVFDGKTDQRYRESDPIGPLSVYGRSKAAGEAAVRRHLSKHLIVRTAWLYGAAGHNFVKTMLRLGREKAHLRVVADQQGSPTNAADLAAAIQTLACRIQENPDLPWGTYHYCGNGITSWHGFATAIFRLAGEHGFPLKVKTVEAILTRQYPTPAVRPAFSALDCHKIQMAFGIVPPDWQASLARALPRILEKMAE